MLLNAALALATLTNANLTLDDKSMLSGVRVENSVIVVHLDKKHLGPLIYNVVFDHDDINILDSGTKGCAEWGPFNANRTFALTISNSFIDYCQVKAKP